MNDELTATSYAMLGMVALRGPSTAYDLKRALGHLAGEFWAVPHVQHYRETDKLVQRGLLTSAQESRGRRRRVFELTPDGERALATWLAAPAAPLELRDEGLLKLFFSELSDAETVRALAQDQATQYARRLDALDKLIAQFGSAVPPARLAPTGFGQVLYRAARDFWTVIAERPPVPSTRRRQAPR